RECLLWGPLRRTPCGRGHGRTDGTDGQGPRSLSPWQLSAGQADLAGRHKGLYAPATDHVGNLALFLPPRTRWPGGVEMQALWELQSLQTVSLAHPSAPRFPPPQRWLEQVNRPQGPRRQTSSSTRAFRNNPLIPSHPGRGRRPRGSRAAGGGSSTCGSSPLLVQLLQEFNLEGIAALQA
ncbi:hypothetical protein AAFF_G00238830, partial [Aldrovandia affinis]